MERIHPQLNPITLGKHALLRVINPKYADNKFVMTYTLHDSTVVEDKPEYEYSITNTKPGNYNLMLFARPTDGTVISTWSCNLALKVED